MCNWFYKNDLQREVNDPHKRIKVILDTVYCYDGIHVHGAFNIKAN